MSDDAWSAAQYAQNARFVSDLGAPVLALLEPRPGEQILDIGCGDGALTRKLIDAGADVVGVDASESMIVGARALGIEAHVADAHTLDFTREFDAVFSNAAMHWMTQPDAVIAGAARALKPGGRFVAEFGGHGNVAAIRTALIAILAQFGIETDLKDVWYFPSVAEHQARLEAAGFIVEEIMLVPRPTPVTAGMVAWLTTLAAPAVAKLSPADREEALDRLSRLLAPALQDSDGGWWADYVRLRFRARLEK